MEHAGHVALNYLRLARASIKCYIQDTHTLKRMFRWLLMKIRFGTNSNSYELGIYMTNWDYPIGYKWEIGIYLFKWIVGIELYR